MVLKIVEICLLELEIWKLWMGFVGIIGIGGGEGVLEKDRAAEVREREREGRRRRRRRRQLCDGDGLGRWIRYQSNNPFHG